MDGKRASLMVTDPPYLVNYDGGNHPPSTTGPTGGSELEEQDQTLGRLP